MAKPDVCAVADTLFQQREAPEKGPIEEDREYIE